MLTFEEWRGKNTSWIMQVNSGNSITELEELLQEAFRAGREVGWKEGFKDGFETIDDEMN